MTDLSPAQLTAINKAVEECTTLPCCFFGEDPLHTRSDELAFELADELVREAGCNCQINSNRRNKGMLQWICTFQWGRLTTQGADPSRQVAICLAYLRARGVDVEKLLKEAE